METNIRSSKKDTSMYDKLFESIESTMDQSFDTLFELLKQPSISSQDVGVFECAEVVQSVMIDHGLDARLIQTSSYPLVYGEKIVGESKPTVLFYGHYDVQPVTESEWDSDPFEPEIRDGAIYARGSGDNKGQFLSHILAANAVERTTGALPVNVKILLEGEEENGSAGLVEFLDTGPEEVDCDLIYVADGSMHDSRRPTIIYGCRGMVGLELSLQTTASHVHSGNYGGPVPNAANKLLSVLSSLYQDERILIPNFYDEINITNAHQSLVDEIPIDTDSIKDELGIQTFDIDDDDEYYQELLLEPTLNINGIQSGYDGDGMKTIIPNSANAKVDLRLLPGQQPDTIYQDVVEFLCDLNPNVEVAKLGSFPPLAENPETPAAEAVVASLETAWGLDVVEIPILPGSLPAGYFKRATDVPILVVPYANPDQNNHGPNEHLDKICFKNGIKTSAVFLTEFDN